MTTAIDTATAKRLILFSFALHALLVRGGYSWSGEVPQKENLFNTEA